MSFAWQITGYADVAARLLSVVGPTRPAVVAVNGFSSGGKTTFARRLSEQLPGSAVLSTDDLAWWHSVLAWDDLLVEGVLAPYRRGEPVRYRPPAWEERDRPGAVEVPAGTEILLVEGVGSGRRSLAAELDAHLWVETFSAVRVNRTSARVAAGEMAFPAYQRWDAEERHHLLSDEPWLRADLVVCGDQRLPHDPTTEILLAQG